MSTLFEKIDEAYDNAHYSYSVFLCEHFLKTEPESAPCLLRYARGLIELSNYSLAENAILEAERLAPRNKMHVVRSERAHLFKAKGEHERAAESFLLASSSKPEDSSYLILAASSYFSAGLLNKAIETSKRATKCKEGHIDEAWGNLGAYLMANRSYEEAKYATEKALSIDPNTTNFQTNLEDINKVLSSELA